MSTEFNPPPPTLETLRRSLDNIDCAILMMLAERFKVTNQIGLLKKAHKLPPVDPVREDSQVKRIHEIASHSGLDPQFAERVWRLVVAEVVQNHKRIEGE